MNKNSIQKNVNRKNIYETITQKEMLIVECIIKGLTNKEIAKKLFLSTHTVKAYVSTIMEKLNVKNRVQLAATVVKNDLVKL